MGILDDAIKEHLDLKRRHGARESELREIEEDAFGSGEGPDPFAAGELFQKTPPPGESEPGAGPATPPGGAGGDEPTRLIQPTASAEAPPAEPPPAEAPPTEPPPAGFEPSSPEPPGAGPPRPAPPPSEPEPSPFDSEPPAASEPEAPGPPAGLDEPGTGELPGSEPPLESQSLADLMAEEDVEPDPGAPGTPPPSGATPEAPPAPAPSDEGLAPTETPREPQIPAAPEPEIPPAPVEPEAPSDSGADLAPELPLDPSEVPDPPPPPPPGSEPPGRARGRVHHPTEEFVAEAESAGPESEEIAPPSSGPLEPEGARPGADQTEPAVPAAEGEPELFDFESDAAPVESAPADDFEDLGPVSDEAYPEDEAYVEEPGTEAQPAPPDTDEGFAEPAPEEGYADPGTEESFAPPAPEPPVPDAPTPDAPAPAEEGEDLLADSPEFADEGGDEDEQDLWFEKGPPQEFDFEDEDR